MKPVGLVARAIENSSRIGDSIYEPFSGSGTAILAAEQHQRRCCAIEIAPVYVDVAIRRWQAATGMVATLDGSGQTWAAVAADRGIRTVAPEAGPEPDPAPTSATDEGPDTGQRGAKAKKRGKPAESAA